MTSYPLPKRATILIVDDQPTNIQALANLLKDDYYIQVATNGLKALQLTLKNLPDLILLDIEMPGMDGYEVCRHLKEKVDTKSIPVIFVTARGAAEDEEKGFRIGAVDYISKPFHPAIVRARVKSQTERKRFEEALKESKERYRKISDISSYFISLPVEEIYERIHFALKTVGEFYQVDQCYVFEFFQGGQKMVKTHSWLGEGLQFQDKKEYLVASFPWWANKIKTEEYLYIPQVDGLPKEAQGEKKELQSQQIKSFFNVPIIIDGTLFGFFGCDMVKEKQIFTDEDQMMMLIVVTELIANALARHLANEKIISYTNDLEIKRKQLEQVNALLDEEIDKARRVHENTLSKMRPVLDDLEVYDYHQPASKVGGDFFDYIILQENVLLFYISDITGHGLDAAMMSAFVKNTISTYVKLVPYQENQYPGKIMDFMFNHYMSERYPEDYFITILLGVLDLNNYKFTYCSAGMHISPFFFKEKELIELPAGGLPISTAIPEDLFYFHNHQIHLDPNSILFFSTDGLVEQRVGNITYGNGFLKIIKENHHLSAAEIGREINKDYYAFTGQMIGDDDITYLVMKIGGATRIADHKGPLDNC